MVLLEILGGEYWLRRSGREALEGWLCRCRKQQARVSRVSRVSWATYVYDGGGEEIRENIPRNYTRHLPKETVRGLAGWGGPVYGIVCRCVSPTLGAKQSFVSAWNLSSLPASRDGLEVCLPGLRDA